MPYKYKGREKEYLREYHQRLKKEHPEKIREWNDKWNKSDKARESWNKYDASHREQRRAYNKKWREKNRKKISASVLKRLKTDPEFAFKARTRHCVRDSVGRLHLKKSKKTEEIVGMPLDELKKYLLETLKNNYGTEWNGEPYHIDHIIPLIRAKSLDEVETLCHYTNLQMLKPEDNLKKGAK